MGRVAFVFSGQGAQYPGMGRELYDCSAAARAVFDRADAIRPGTGRQCFEGTDEELKETRNTQPCMFAVELAAAAALEEAGVRADMAAGFSLGELAALTFAGVMNFDTGFRLVCSRGERMQAASEAQDTAMAAVLRLENAAVEEVCKQFEGVYPVNYNCPGQVTVSGLASQMDGFAAAVKAAGGRAMPLKVRGAFHSPYMAEAARGFADDLRACALKAPALPVYANRTAQPYGEDVLPVLAEQIDHPVLWEATVRNMVAAGADTFIEVGPGRTLCGLIAKTDKGVRTFSTEKAEDLRKAVEGVLG